MREKRADLKTLFAGHYVRVASLAAMREAFIARHMPKSTSDFGTVEKYGCHISGGAPSVPEAHRVVEEMESNPVFCSLERDVIAVKAILRLLEHLDGPDSELLRSLADALCRERRLDAWADEQNVSRPSAYRLQKKLFGLACLVFDSVNAA